MLMSNFVILLPKKNSMIAIIKVDKAWEIPETINPYLFINCKFINVAKAPDITVAIKIYWFFLTRLKLMENWLDISDSILATPIKGTTLITIKNDLSANIQVINGTNVINNTSARTPEKTQRSYTF